MHFILGAKPKDHKCLRQDVDGVRCGGLLSSHEDTDDKGKRYRYEWVHAVPLNSDLGGEVVNYVELQIFDAKGKCTYHNNWVTDLEVSEENVCELVRGARARWKIENEGFNTLKNHGYHLEHNFVLRGVLFYD